MKHLKALPIIFMLAIPALAGCGGDKYVETRTEEEIVNGLGIQAMSEIGVSYSVFSSDGVTPGDHKLITEMNQKVWDNDQYGINFSITYTLVAQEQYEENYLSLNPDTMVLTCRMVPDSAITEAKYPVGASLGGAAYTLTAKMTFKGYADGFVAPKGLNKTDSLVGSEIKTQKWNALARCVKSGTIGEIKAAYNSTNTETKINDGDYIFTTGRVTAAYDWQYSEIFRGVIISDGYYGLLLYAGCLQKAFYDENQQPLIKEGDIISIYGKVVPYMNLLEVKPETINIVNSQSEKDAIAPVAYREGLSVEDTLKLKFGFTGDLIKLTNLKVYSTKSQIEKLVEGDHWEIKVSGTAEGAKPIEIAVNYHVGAAAQTAIKNFLLDTRNQGKTFNFTGVVSATTGKIQITPMVIGNVPCIDQFVRNA